MADNHILLLPRDNYFEWVRSAAKYVLAFGVNITPDPQKAGQKYSVTVVIAPGAYAEEGDIIVWFNQNYPDSQIDAIRVSSTDELSNRLQKRVDVGLQFGASIDAGASDEFQEELSEEIVLLEEVFDIAEEDDVTIDTEFEDISDDLSFSHSIETEEITIPVLADVESVTKTPSVEHPFRLYWPTDYPKVTQSFGANPEIYSKWGLPGHEGVDIRAPMNTNVYACADGEIYFLIDEAAGHPYGKHVRIRHKGGFRTVYAHLARVEVEIGEVVKSGQIIGKANSTGNSTGSHLHLTLKKEGATARKETQFKGDVIDPTPFLIFPHFNSDDLQDASKKIKYPWSRPSLVGINVRDDGFMYAPDFEVVRRAQIEAVKIQESTPTKVIQRLQMMRNDMFIVARLAFDLGQTAISSSEWAARIMPDLARLYDLGIHYYEIHQSPNLQTYGWNYSWHSGGGFARWWLDVVHRLRDRYPEAKFGFPGVSPGGQVEGQRLDAKTFMEQADDAVHVADWVGVNCFWVDSAEMENDEKGTFYKFIRRRFPDKLIFVTEFGNVNILTNPYVKGKEYLKFYQSLRDTPGIGACFAQVMSSARGFEGMQWRLESEELTQIPIQIGKRTF